VSGVLRSVTYPVLVLHEALVVATDGNEEEQAVDVLEAVNPLLSLRSLAAHVEHAIRELAQVKSALHDTRCPQPAAEKVLVVRDVSVGPYALHVLDEAADGQQGSTHGRLPRPETY